MNDKKYKGISGVTVVVFIAVVFFVLWMTSRVQMRGQEMTFTQFEQEIKDDNVTEVVINQNKAVPTGVVTLTLRDSRETGRVNVSDVNETQKLLDKNDVEYRISAIPQDSVLSTTVLPVVLMLVGFMFITMMMNRQSGGANAKAMNFGKSRARMSSENDKKVTFAELLQMVEKIDGLERIRFMTPHPKDLSDDLIDVMSKSKKICNHVHLPLQSGSSRLLKKMNRNYTKEQYLALVDRIRDKMPDVSLTTDIIVGFPGETEEDFEDTLDVVRKAQYDSAYTFIYSKRTGTPAARMEDQIDEAVVKERFNRLLDTVNEVSHSISARYTGTVQKALVEAVNDHDSSLVTGRLTNNMLVHFPGDKELVGSIVNVSLDECKGFYYMGTML